MIKGKEKNLPPKPKYPPMENGLKLAVEAAGGLRAFARKVNLTHQAVMSWGKVPAERVIEIEELTGIARERLRPDLYRLSQSKD